MSKLKKLRLHIRSVIYGPNKFFQCLNTLRSSKETKAFYKEKLQWSPKVAEALDKTHPRVDRFILTRRPKLVFENQSKSSRVAIQDYYSPENEIRLDNAPYKHFAESLFRSNIIDSNTRNIVDIGCTSGNLLSEISKIKPSLELCGIEAFSFFKLAADKNIADKIYIFDLRNENLPLENKFDLVVCTEVGEHIDPQCIDVFIEHLWNLTSRLLVISWSSTFPPPDAPPQHLSVLTSSELEKVLIKFNFSKERNLSRDFLKEIEKDLSSNRHWLDSLSVWRKND